MKKVISLILVMLMLVSAVPMSASAGLIEDLACAAGNHATYKEEVVTAATCGTVGVARVYCSNCNKVLETKVIPATEVHTPTNVAAVAATCLTAGKTAGVVCSVCNDILTGCDEIKALGHDVKDVPAADPTCEVNGLTAGRRCIRLGCDYVVIPQTEVAPLGHIWKTTKTVDSTCYEKGYILKECQRKDCNATDVTDIPESHNFSAFVTTKAPTCTVDGEMTKTCSKCKQVIKDIIPKLGHTWIDSGKSVAPTCVKEGIDDYKCSSCPAVKNGIVPATGHKTTVKKGYPPTCIKNGMTDGHYCSACNEQFVKQEEIAPTGHIVNQTKWVVYVNATCTNEGIKMQSCLVCNENVREAVPALGHRNVEIIPGTTPTCTLSGVQDAIRCKDCGQWLKEQVEIPALGHDCSYKITATCTENGVLYSQCKRCDYYKEEVVVAFGHDYIKENKPTKEPTCVENGTWKYKCGRCGDIKEEEIPQYGHTYQPEWQTIIAPTCTGTGVSIKICKDCFNIQTSTLSIIPHSDSDADNKCDMCSLDMTPPQPEIPDIPSDNCNCSCHKSGIVKFFFNIGLFFQKLFKKNAVCDCGVAHY